MELLAWFGATDLSLWVRESNYGYYILLNGHAIGMALVVGVVLMLDLRVLGYAKGLSISIFDKLLWVGWLGFAVNATTGLILFLAQGERYLQNLPFLIKLLLIVFGGLAMWLLGRALRNTEQVSGQGVVASGKLFAIFSGVFWIAAIAAGRLIAYTLDPPPPPALL